MRAMLFAMAILLAVPGLGHTQQQAGSSHDAARRAALEARRDSLEAEIMNRFVEQLSRELKLDATQRAQTERALRTGAHRRRELMRASGELRGEMIRALRNPATTDAEFSRLLAQQESLRLRESDLWTREQDELARILNPRQRTQFAMQWARFQDDVREIVAQQMRGGSRR
jgi:Spy/CpxP family protein refolding chaperone